MILGLGFSAIYASLYAFLEQHIKITNIIGALFTCAGGAFQAAYPAITGQFVEDNPVVFNYVNISSTIFCFLSYCILLYLVKRSKKFV